MTCDVNTRCKHNLCNLSTGVLKSEKVDQLWVHPSRVEHKGANIHEIEYE